MVQGRGRVRCEVSLWGVICRIQATHNVEREKMIKLKNSILQH